MIIFASSIIVAAAIFFAGWLFFSFKKEHIKPRYTEELNVPPLVNMDKMLSNITEKDISPDNEKTIETNTDEEEKIETKEKEHKEQTNINNSSEDDFDLEQAIISSAIINRKEKKH